MSLNTFSLVQLFTRKGLPFVLYSLPGKKEIIFIVQKTTKLYKGNLSEIDKLKGFLITEFVPASDGELFYIKADIRLDNGVVDSQLMNYLDELPDVQEQPSTKEYISSKSDYLQTATKLITSLNSGELQKVVLSRIIQNDTGVIDNGEFFNQLVQKYPKAFVYLLHLPQMGLWAGATPETLINIHDGIVETEALAGTKPVNNINWTDKEKEEQELVVTYIEEALREKKVRKFEKVGPINVHAANIAHLRTTFKIAANQFKGTTGEFIALLHPTPAVCGLPKEKAFNWIQHFEKHDRKLYTGFLGPWNLFGQSSLFVNLRCARLEESSAFVYVGGGITAKSDAEAEWEETENKAQTLLSVLKNL